MQPQTRVTQTSYRVHVECHLIRQSVNCVAKSCLINFHLTTLLFQLLTPPPSPARGGEVHTEGLHLSDPHTPPSPPQKAFIFPYLFPRRIVTLLPQMLGHCHY